MGGKHDNALDDLREILHALQTTMFILISALNSMPR